MTRVKLSILLLLVAAASSLYAAKPEIFEGSWQDGTKLEWACPTGLKAVVPIRITLTSGDQYTAVLQCGGSV